MIVASDTVNCRVRSVEEFLNADNTVITFDPLPGAALTGPLIVTVTGLSAQCGYIKGDLCLLALPKVVEAT